MFDAWAVFVAISWACLYRVIKSDSWREITFMTVVGLVSAGMALSIAIGVRQ